MRKPLLVVAIFLVTAVASVQAASWHYGNWGNYGSTCTVGYSTSWATGQSYSCSGDACAHIITGHGVRNVQVRGKAFIGNNYGYGPWVGQGLTSHHDCGLPGCGYLACKVRVFI
jgi:hypothetical protein